MANQKDSLSFDRNEVEALREIVSDWLSEEIAVPPFAPDMEAVLRKLGLAPSGRAKAAPKSKNDRTPTGLKPQDQISGRPSSLGHQSRLGGGTEDRGSARHGREQRTGRGRRQT
jgi:hypothetical protein